MNLLKFWKTKTKMQIKPQTKISRTKIIEGVAIPAIIHNSSYFFVDLTVYEDGTIECWELTDLELFRIKLARGWVKTAVPNGESISIHGLGSWKIDDGNWILDKKSFYEYVFSIITTLNPQMNNFYKIYEKKINGVKIMESGEGNVFKEQKRFENDLFPKKINGDSFNLFLKQNDKYYLVNLVVFADEKIQIHRIPEILELNFEDLEKEVKSGNILTQIPENSRVEIYGLGSFSIQTADYPCTSIQDKLLEVRDLIEKLNNRKTSSEICCAIYKRYLENPSVNLREKLKVAYEKIPTHLRRYVIGDMDAKDIPIRMIIYGEDEIKNWSHYIVSEKLGEKLPTINVPKPKDE